jgi:endonuclease/exonuclease/phosphatase family metal-dependent hydrolase
VSPDVKVLTANINLLRPNEGIHSWQNRRAELVKVLDQINAGIIGMQASTPAQTAWLITHLPAYGHFPDGAAIHRNLATALAGPLSTWNQIWYHRRRFQFIAGTYGMVRPNHPQNNPTENTYFSLAVLRDRAGYFPDLIVLDVHLRHWEINAVKSAEKLHTILLTWHKRYPAAQVILLGDMNHSRSQHAIYQALLGNASNVPLVDTFDYALHKPGQQWGTWENYTHHVYSPWPTDLIFVSPQLAHWPAQIIQYHVRPAQYPSKHLFVLTVLQPHRRQNKAGGAKKKK